MAKYQMSDSTMVDTDNSTRDWQDIKDDEALYRSRRGRYYVVHQARGPDPWAEWLSHEKAAFWILGRGLELPKELQSAGSRITE